MCAHIKVLSRKKGSTNYAERLQRILFRSPRICHTQVWMTVFLYHKSACKSRSEEGCTCPIWYNLITMPCHHVMPLNPKETTLTENRKWQVGERRSATVFLLRGPKFSVSPHNNGAGTALSAPSPRHGLADTNTSQQGQKCFSSPRTNPLWDPTQALFNVRWGTVASTGMKHTAVLHLRRD